MTADELWIELARPFGLGEVKFKPAVVKGNRAMALAYIDARLVMDRLDEVVGPGNWKDSYEFLPSGIVVCALSVRVPGSSEWVTKVDVGGQSEQEDDGDKTKAAVSDALKRAAVKFGLGRFLYRLPAQWVDYDPQRRAFTKEPTLPESLTKAAQEGKNTRAKAKSDKARETGKAVLEAAKTIDMLSAAWKTLTDVQRSACEDIKDEMKKRLTKNGEPAC